MFLTLVYYLIACITVFSIEQSHSFYAFQFCKHLLVRIVLLSIIKGVRKDITFPNNRWITKTINLFCRICSVQTGNSTVCSINFWACCLKTFSMLSWWLLVLLVVSFTDMFIHYESLSLKLYNHFSRKYNWMDKRLCSKCQLLHKKSNFGSIDHQLIKLYWPICLLLATILNLYLTVLMDL